MVFSEQIRFKVRNFLYNINSLQEVELKYNI